MENDVISYIYKFKFQDRTEKIFKVFLDEITLDLIVVNSSHLKEWTKLNNHKCENCSLTCEYCPVAENIAGIIEYFKEKKPNELIELEIKSESRNYIKKVLLKDGLSSLLGIYMVVSKCPVMEKLKPMVKFHLPFSTSEETNYRVLSMYLLSQYFSKDKNKISDWELNDLIDIYIDIQKVNLSFKERLATFDNSGVSTKALENLNSFSENIPKSIINDMLNEIEILFETYINKDVNLDRKENDDKINYLYIFEFDDEEKVINVTLDKKNLCLITDKDKDNYKWTELSCEKCSNCSLDPKKNKYCPIAYNLSEIIDFFKDKISYEKVFITVKSGNRIYNKKTTVQSGLSSLIGIYMVTSGCPIMEKLKPMVSFHLPFASLSETNYRVLSMYLLAQYFVKKHGGKPDWEFKELIKIYKNIQIVNHSFCKRLNSIEVEDASLNAIVTLSCFADFVPSSIIENMLDDIETLFLNY